MKEKSSRILDENSIKGPENEEEWREKYKETERVERIKGEAIT